MVLVFPQTAAGYTIPVGHQVCVSPTVNHRLHDTWDERMEFSPDRYLNDNPAAGEKFAYVPFGAGGNSFNEIISSFVSLLVFNSTHLSSPPLDIQADIGASGRTSPTSRSKPSGPLYFACTTSTWRTDISQQSTTLQWFTPLTTPSSDTRGENSERGEETDILRGTRGTLLCLKVKLFSFCAQLPSPGLTLFLFWMSTSHDV